MNLNDEIDGIMFRNDENGYSVVRLKNSGLIAVGTFHYVTVGQEFDLVGDFVQNAKYGKQFVVKSYTLVPPNSPAKIRDFLGSGLIFGVGMKTAERIVKQFGKDALSIIENDPEKLEVVKGISPRKAKLIGERYGEIKEMQTAIVYLQRFDISMNLALRIYNHYKERTIECVQVNPYCLIETIDGIGFITADRIAQDLGINYAGSFRVRAGVVYVLKQSSEQDGNTFLPREVLRLGVCRLLKIKMEQLEPVFDGIVRELCLDKYLTAVDDGYMLNKFYVAERAIAAQISKLCCLKQDVDVSSFDGLLVEYQRTHKITLHEKQIEAIKSACSNGISVITGGPGTGKTTIVRAILYLAAAGRKTAWLLAPTGRAAKRLEETTGHAASTIHRALDIDYKGGKGIFTYDDPANVIQADIVIVDEVSMCDCILMSQLLRKVLMGTRVILVGDSDQLPSVGAGNVLADIIASGVVPMVTLVEIYRQSENSQIVASAHAINRGEMPALDNKSTDFYYESAETPAQIKHKILSLVTDRIPKYLGCGHDRIQVLCPMKLGEAGMNSLNVNLQENLNPAESGKGEYVYGETTFRVGDRVMQTVNNYNQEWTRGGTCADMGAGVFNGDIGTVFAVDRQSGEVSVALEDGRETVYTRADLGNLVLAYAITVHKSQGCEFDVVVIPVTSGAYMILTRNLLYTAVTRAKKMVMLVGSRENLEKMVGNTYTKKRHTALRKFMVEEMNKAKDVFEEN
jgi:exodeoxyribonuclease V alpha subunit